MTIKTALAIVIEGGLVQDIVSPDPALFRDVDILVIDYDTEGACPGDCLDVPQSDGDTASAYVRSRGATRASVDLDALHNRLLEG